MGHAQGMSMLYLEARCISVVRAAGSQGVQNGSISCVALVLAVPGRDARDPGRERDRRLARSRGRVRKRRDRLAFRDPQDGEADGAVPPGHRLRHVGLLGHAAARQHLRRRQLRRRRHRRVAHDPARLAGGRRDRAGRRGRGAARPASARRGRCRRCSTSSGCPPVTDAEVEAATTRLRRRATCPTATAPPTWRRPTPRSSAASRGSTSPSRSTGAASTTSPRRSSPCSASASSADYLQTSAVIDAGRPRPLRRQRPERLPRARHRLPPRRRALGAAAGASARGRRVAARHGGRGRGGDRRRRRRRARPRAPTRPRSWSRSGRPSRTRSARRSTGSPTATCSRRCWTGSRRRVATPRLVRVRRVADVAFIAHDGACLSGSGVALGIQSKGTAVIHRADLQPLDNLELFGMSPLYSLESYRAMGRNAAGYALGQACRPGADRARQLRPREADRPHDAAARARDARGRRAARRPSSSTLARPRDGACGRTTSRRGGAAAHSKALRAGAAPAAPARPRPPRGRGARAARRSPRRSTSACSVVIRMPPRFWSFAAEIPQSRSGGPRSSRRAAARR